jgi:hypothetical protein
VTNAHVRTEQSDSARAWESLQLQIKAVVAEAYKAGRDDAAKGV